MLIKQNWLKAYKFMRAEASNQLNDKTNKDEDSPLKKIGEKTVIVQPITVVRLIILTPIKCAGPKQCLISKV